MSQSSDGQQSNQPFVSQYPELKIPEEGFVSSLPKHLLEGADEQTKWIMNEISRNSAATEFACHGAVELSSHLRALNGKTFRNEKGLQGVRDDMADLKKEVIVLQDQMKSVSPIVGTVSTVRLVFSNKISWIILGLAGAFLLGLNRDTVWKILQYFFAP